MLLSICSHWYKCKFNPDLSRSIAWLFGWYNSCPVYKNDDLVRTLRISIRWRNIHTSQAKRPLNLAKGRSTTALFLLTVAMAPRLRYSYSLRLFSLERFVGYFARFLPCPMATLLLGVSVWITGVSIYFISMAKTSLSPQPDYTVYLYSSAGAMSGNPSGVFAMTPVDRQRIWNVSSLHYSTWSHLSCWSWRSGLHDRPSLGDIFRKFCAKLLMVDKVFDPPSRR